MHDKLTEAEARELRVGADLVYLGSDYQWHHAHVIARHAGRLVIELEAMEPGELALPTERVRWWLTGRHTHGEIVRVEGEAGDVERFVRHHWGDEEIDGYGREGDGPAWRQWVTDHRAQEPSDVERCACGREVDENGEHDGGYGAHCG